MKKISKSIAIVSSTKASLSSMSQISRDAAHEALGRFYENVSIVMVDDFNDLQALADSAPDLVFLGMEYVYDQEGVEKIWIADFLTAHDIAITGSSSGSHKLGSNKCFAKQCIQDAGLNTPNYLVVEQGQTLNEQDVKLEYPLFVKPTGKGGGVGINCDSVVHDFESLVSKVSNIAKYCASDSLIEEYAPGREFTVAILKLEYTNEYLVMPIELIAEPDVKGERMLSRRVKNANTEKTHAVIDNELKAQLRDLSINAFTALGARDYGRVDIRLDKHGIPTFLEANLIPSLISGYGSFPKACWMNKGMGYDQMILTIAKLALRRQSSIVVHNLPFLVAEPVFQN
jgi:D-alanine-D-alanine ligase